MGYGSRFFSTSLHCKENMNVIHLAVVLMLCLIAVWSLESCCLNTNKDFIVKDNNSRHMGTAAEESASLCLC